MADVSDDLYAELVNCVRFTQNMATMLYESLARGGWSEEKREATATGVRSLLVRATHVLETLDDKPPQLQG